jgi:hypothetical protein
VPGRGAARDPKPDDAVTGQAATDLGGAIPAPVILSDASAAFGDVARALVDSMTEHCIPVRPWVFGLAISRSTPPSEWPA